MSVGRRTSIELRLLRYHLSRSQAYYLAKSGLERIYQEKIKDNNTFDSLNESWNNTLKDDTTPEFKNFPLGNGKFTIQYSYYEAKDKEPKVFYGMQDEQSKFNINAILEDETRYYERFKKFLKNILEDIKDADEDTLTDTFLDWIDANAQERLNGKEEYKDEGIIPKNKPLERIEELLMISGFTPEIVGIVSKYLTVYGDATVNVNTAPKEVLVIAGFDEGEVKKILDYRNDAKDIKEISDTYWSSFDIIEDGKLCLPSGSENRIDKARLGVHSNVFRAVSYSMVNKVSKKITAVVEIKPNQPVKKLYEYEE